MGSGLLWWGRWDLHPAPSLDVSRATLFFYPLKHMLIKKEKLKGLLEPFMIYVFKHADG